MIRNQGIIKIALIGSGEWGSRVRSVVESIGKYEITGVVNSSTTLEEKMLILESSDTVYIAVPPESQHEYLEYCLTHDKKTFCESPFITDDRLRRQIVSLKAQRDPEFRRFFYINYPYVNDILSSPIHSAAVSNAASYCSIKCTGPRHIDSPNKAKKLYSTQAINFIFQTFGKYKPQFKSIRFHDNNNGSIYYEAVNKDTQEPFTLECAFSWESTSSDPYMEYKIIHVNGKSQSDAFGYDEYDQVSPLLLTFLNLDRANSHSLFGDPMSLNGASVTRYALEQSIKAEWISDLFVAMKDFDIEIPYSVISMGRSSDESFIINKYKNITLPSHSENTDTDSGANT